MKNIDIAKFRRYYKELFDLHSEELFKRLFGVETDENGDKYTSIYVWELKEISENFCDFMITLDIYNEDKNATSIGNYLVFQMDGLADIKYPKGVDFIAKSIIAATREKATINGIEHPLRDCEEGVEPVIIDGDVPKSYVLIQDNGYYEEEMSSRVVATSKDKKKLELLCDDRVGRLKSTAKFVGYQEIFEVYNSYRQLVDEARKLRINWRIDEVLEV